MARCTECGATIKAKSKSCDYCGATIEVGAFESLMGLAEDRFKKRDEASAATREAAAESERTEAKNRPKVLIGSALVWIVLMFMLFAMSWNERQWATATTIIISGFALLSTLAIVALIVWLVRRSKTPPVPTYQAPAQPAGWYPDPTSRHQYRYWVGNMWAAHVCDGDAVCEDPI